MRNQGRGKETPEVFPKEREREKKDDKQWGNVQLP